MPVASDGGQTSKVESSVYDSSPTFNPYDPEQNTQDPEAVQPTSPGPAQSSSAPGIGDTSGEDGEQEPEAPPQGEVPEAPPLPEFDPRHREHFIGLLYLGRIQKTVHLWGHEFVIRTLTTEQLAEIGLITKRYEGTSVVNAVYQAAVVAAAVITVDGKPLPSSIVIDDSEELTNVKFPYVFKNWMPPVRERIYNESYTLEIEVRQVLDAMEKASG